MGKGTKMPGLNLKAFNVTNTDIRASPYFTYKPFMLINYYVKINFILCLSN
ncbi:hypothetical protein LX80_00165 [Hydrotalea sandarakina]|uniref:Uncharacterized protein n=1 Tax=Hydrotalea sandarakina TaxID=1004304 RepID=A0A2W7SRM6_9BACT|nr:hypothetical protein LX80_00165 [Hydrotalea sandarakina]